MNNSPALSNIDALRIKGICVVDDLVFSSNVSRNSNASLRASSR